MQITKKVVREKFEQFKAAYRAPDGWEWRIEEWNTNKRIVLFHLGGPDGKAGYGREVDVFGGRWRSTRELYEFLCGLLAAKSDIPYGRERARETREHILKLAPRKHHKFEVIIIEGESMREWMLHFYLPEEYAPEELVREVTNRFPEFGKLSTDEAIVNARVESV